MSLAGPVQAPPPPAVAAGFWGTPVVEEDAPARRSPLRLARVGYRSKSRRGGCKTWWLLMTLSGQRWSRLSAQKFRFAK
jgi:hypothetical protein